MKYILFIFLLSTCVLTSMAQDAVTIYKKALVLKNERKCAEAIPLLQKALELKPDYAEALHAIGWCYNETKQFDKAIPQLQKAILIDSSFAIAYAEIGYSFYSTQQYTMAIGNLNMANRLNPKVETTLYYLGLSFVRLNSKADAVKKYNELSLMNSSYADKLLEEIKMMK